MKDVGGFFITYYPISELKTRVHGVYNEAMEHVYDNPIVLDCIVDSHFQDETKTQAFGPDARFKIEVFVQYRDMVDKGIKACIGDFFSFSDIFYEVTDLVYVGNIFGLPEHRRGVKLTGMKARDSQFKAQLKGPTDIKYTDDDAVQKKFEQQRGLASNSSGPTGDVRDLIKENVLDAPLTGQREVSEKGTGEDNSTASPGFYDE